MSELIRIAFPICDRFDQIKEWFSLAGLPIAGFERPGLHFAADPWDCGMEIECFSVSHADVGTYVERGIAHIGIMSSDLIFQTHCHVWAPYTLPFGRYPAVLAAQIDVDLKSLTFRPILRLATSLSDQVYRWFSNRGIAVEVVRVADRPEMAVLLGLADAFVAVIDENHELQKEGFHVIDILYHTELKLVVNDSLSLKRRYAIQKIIDVLQSVPVKSQPKVYIPY